MRQSIRLVGVVIAVLVMLHTPASGQDDSSQAPGSGGTKPQLESMLKTVLEGVDGTEVIVSRVTLPPHTALPKHWHPGEEFAYILDGSVTLWQKGKEDIVGEPGDVMKIPLKQVHTAITKEKGATILVFRVHEQGQPERVLVEED